MPPLQTATQPTDSFLNLNDAYQLSTAVLIVIFVTQTIQQLTGWNPKWIGAVVSLLTAILGVFEQASSLPWYAAILQALIRACQLYCMAGGAVGLTAQKSWGTQATSPQSTEPRAETIDASKSRKVIRPFWIRWF